MILPPGVGAVFPGRPVVGLPSVTFFLVDLFTFCLALADFLLDLVLFRVGMTKVLSNMRSLESPACEGATAGYRHSSSDPPWQPPCSWVKIEDAEAVPLTRTLTHSALAE